MIAMFYLFKLELKLKQINKTLKKKKSFSELICDSSISFLTTISLILSKRTILCFRIILMFYICESQNFYYVYFKTCTNEADGANITQLYNSLMCDNFKISFTRCFLFLHCYKLLQKKRKRRYTFIKKSGSQY